MLLQNTRDFRSGVCFHNLQNLRRFDYTSFKPVPPDAQPFTDEELREFVARNGVDDPLRASELRVSLLRASSTKMWLSADQAVALVRLFSKSDERVEVAVIAYARILDKNRFWKVGRASVRYRDLRRVEGGKAGELV
jgi:hypothetical protein